MSLEAWRELRRQQAVRAASASRGRRPAELERYLEVCEQVAILEAQASTGAEVSCALPGVA